MHSGMLKRSSRLRSHIAGGLDVRCSVRLDLLLAAALLELLFSIPRIVGVNWQC